MVEHRPPKSAGSRFDSWRGRKLIIMKWITVDNPPSEEGNYVVKYQNYILWDKTKFKTSNGAMMSKFKDNKFQTRNHITHWLLEN